MIRWVVTAAFLGLAAGIIWLAFFVGAETPRGNLLINLGTEIVGIVITVAVVEWFFEKRRHNTRGRQLAWEALHALEHAGETVVVAGRAAYVLLAGDIHTSKVLSSKQFNALGQGTARTVKVLRTVTERWC